MLHLQKVHQSEESILHNLMQYYIYEFSKYIPEITLEQSGKYKPFDLKDYWIMDNYHAYFIKLNEELIGFALVESTTESRPNTIKEFFIIAKHSGKGYGRRIARELLGMFPGDWKITQIENNEAAHLFWVGVIKEVTESSFYERFEEGKYIQEFSVQAIR